MKYAFALVLLRGADSFAPTRRRLIGTSRLVLSVDPRRQQDTRSLGEKMFGDVFGGLKNLVSPEEPETTVVEQAPLDAARAISAIDQRAADGTITYQVHR